MGILVQYMCRGGSLQLTQGSWGGQLICLGYFSSELVDFVSRLLSRYKENMLCSEGSVREHCWFRENNCDEEEDVTSLCTWGQESGMDQGR